MSASGNEGVRVEFSFRDFLARMWAEAWLIGLSVAALLLLVVIAIAAMPVRYSATMLVAPVRGGLIENAGSQNALTGFAALLGTGGETVTPFNLYLKTYAGPDIAATVERKHAVMREVFAERWDGANRRWRVSQGPGNILRSFFGIPHTDTPTVDDLRDFLTRHVTVTPGDGNEVQTITFLHTEPVFARQLLQWLHEEAENITKIRVQENASNNVQYLTQKIGTITQNDQRQVLAGLLAQQESLLMLSQSWNSYAADVIQKPVASVDPVSPNPVQLLALGIAGGVIAGCAIVFLRLLAGFPVVGFADFLRGLRLGRRRLA